MEITISSNLAVSDASPEVTSINITIESYHKLALAVFESIFKATIVSVAIVVNSRTVAILQSGFPGSNVNPCTAFQCANA